MTCAEFQRWFSPHIDGQLAPQQRAELERHLQDCARCRADLASLHELVRTVRAMERPATPNLLPGIHARLQRAPWWRTVPRRFVAPWPASLPVHGAALALATLLVVVLVALPRTMQQGTSERGHLQLANTPSNGSTSFRQKDSRADGDENVRHARIASLAERRNEAAKPIQLSADLKQTSSPDQSMPTTRGALNREIVDRVATTPVSESPRAASSEISQSSVSGMMAANVRPQEENAIDTGFNEHAPNENGEPSSGKPLMMRKTAEIESSVSTRRAATVGVEVVVGHPMRTLSTEKTPTPTSETSAAMTAAPAPTTPEPARPAPVTPLPAVTTLLPLRWTVPALSVAANQVSEWVSARHGLVVATNPHHLSIRLPSEQVAAFLQQCSISPSEWRAPAEPVWVTISLELVPLSGSP